MRPRLIINFDSLSEAAFEEHAKHVALSLKRSTHFPPPWPPQVTSLEALTAEVDNYAVAYATAQHHDTHAIATRNNLRIDLTTHLQELGAYLEIAAKGDVAALESTGYGVTHTPVKSQSHDPPAAPVGVTFKRGPEGGTGILHAHSDPLVTQWEAEVTSGDPTVEANWGGTIKSEHCNKIVFHGLTPTKTYYSRLRGWNKHGYGPWVTSNAVVIL